MGVYIIAEAGVNHNGSIELAKKLVEKAKEAGADCVKFQTFSSENLVTSDALKADYQKKNTDDTTQLQMLKKLELTYDEFKQLKDFCNEVDIDFISTPFDIESVDFLSKIDMKFWKIPSGEITNLPYLEKISRTGKPIILSTGMCNLQEVKDAIRILENGACKDISILHCTTEYPAPFSECNLNVLETLKKELKKEVGYSDHTKGILAPIIAVAKGAQIIEKHFTLDRNMDGPDHAASLEPAELKEMIDNIRLAEKMLGDGIKRSMTSENSNRLIVRKSIVAKCEIKKGEKLTEDNMTTKRPGTGISPMRWYEIVGTRAVRDYKKDDLITL